MLNYKYADVVDWSVAARWSRQYSSNARYGEDNQKEDLFGEVYGRGNVNAVVQLGCGHIFRQTSIEKWFNQKP
jgi:hypothetical protein